MANLLKRRDGSFSRSRAVTASPGMKTSSNPLFQMKALVSNTSDRPGHKIWDNKMHKAMRSTPQPGRRRLLEKIPDSLNSSLLMAGSRIRHPYGPIRRSESEAFWSLSDLGSFKSGWRHKNKRIVRKYDYSGFHAIVCLSIKKKFTTPSPCARPLELPKKAAVPAPAPAPAAVARTENESILPEVKLVDGRHVVFSGTVRHLIGFLSDPGHLSNQEFAITLLATHKWWVKSGDLLTRISETLMSPDVSKLPEDKQESTKMIVKLRLTNVLKKWIENDFFGFREDDDLMNQLKEFIKKMQASQGKDKELGSVIEKALTSPCQHPKAKDLTYDKPILPTKTDAAQLTFMDISPVELARQITLLDFAQFSKIRPQELYRCSWTKANKHAASPNVMALTERFNKTTFWVATEILTTVNPKSRVEALKNFIQIGEQFLALRNYHGVMCVYAALNMGSIQRLSSTWKEISERHLRKMSEIERVMDSSGNWKIYRELTKDPTPPLVPFQGVMLSDLTQLEEIPDRCEGSGHVNFDKMNLLGGVLSFLEKCQSADYPFEPLPLVQTWLDEQVVLDEGSLYKLSKFWEDPQLASYLNKSSPIYNAYKTKGQIPTDMKQRLVEELTILRESKIFKDAKRKELLDKKKSGKLSKVDSKATLLSVPESGRTRSNTVA
eukprot:CAMPEP_0177646488 /NCGR_PEP_ID=MMETSP0447-20121125/9799_1 /TAXON_ID=0 /ORGANISM="Stygamoeba regulata, Strain BSH-02190019" /LENGTH=664 /DNA_ID=CAMNT_0019149021 /DNA_START=429 /DNA_END=2423 /DNA_ORIENTATION=-